MRRALWPLCVVAGCGGDGATAPDAAVVVPDAPAGTCLPQGAIGAFYRRAGNPRLVGGAHTFGDGLADTGPSDPDLRWDAASGLWHLYYASPHGSSFSSPGPGLIRHATSPDLAGWTLQESPSLEVAASGWDSAHVGAPTVIHDPDAPADRRYILYYSGAAQAFPYPGRAFDGHAIGAAISADGRTFTRISASESPHGEPGLVLTAAQAYPGALAGIVSDPEVVRVNGTYHMWFSSFACSGASCATTDAIGVGHATSLDGVAWTVVAAPEPSLLRASADPTSGGDSPSVVYDALHCRWEMWLRNDQAGETAGQPVTLDNAAGLWSATSATGTSWTVTYQQARDLTWDPGAPGEGLGLRAGADVAQKGTGRYLLYVGFDDENLPAGAQLPTASGLAPGVTTLDLAARDAPP